uniref:Uncharacterized protein n=1 Tax=viral metagenome TaxID=1070528 RepID=A0A6C0IVC4_9ZZZZ
MSTDTNTNSIDEKKEETNNNTTNTNANKTNIKSFLTNYVSSIIITIGLGIFVIGSIGLYTTKVAQANILPDNPLLAPYTDIGRNVGSLPIDINIINDISWSGKLNKTISQKAIFESKEYLDTFKSSLLCSLYKSSDPNSGFFANFALFLSKVVTSMYTKNFAFINTFFLYLSYLPESLIMILYGSLGLIFWFLLYGLNFVLSVFYHITSIPQLFKSPIDEDNINNTSWQADSDVSFSITKFLFFWFLWLPLGFISLFITPIYTTFSTIVAPLYAKYKVMGNETNKSMSVLDFIVNTLFYKKSLFFILATVSLASNAKTYLGPMALVGVIVATIIGYFIGLYSTPNYEQDITNYYSVNLANQEVKKAKASVSREKVKICHKVKEIQMTNTNTFEEGGPLEQEDALNIRGGGKRQATINKNKKYNIKFV